MAVTVETRQFEMDPKLLLDVIQRQAGTLSKAVLEAVMNSVDASATRCEIELTQEHVTIVDDGRGFRNRQEIEKWFEVFGKPHEEGEGKRYGTFRMGRGQMFAFGRNVWRSGQFQMTVDVKHHGRSYDLETGLDKEPGCRIDIDLYAEVEHTRLYYLEQDLKRWCKYIPIPVFYNGEQLSCDPDGEKWDHITEEAYVRLKGSGPLLIYNLGCYVMEHYHGRYGTGGEVVSRQQLKVNFARNDVQSDCPVWKKIEKLVNGQATRYNLKTKSLTPDKRLRLARQLKSGELEWDEQLADKHLFAAANGRHYSLTQLAILRGYEFYSLGVKGEAKADEIMRRKQAFVVAEETLTNFGFAKDDLEGFLFWLKGETGHMWNSRYFKPFTKPRQDLATLAAGLSDDMQFLAEEELTANEQLWLHIAQRNSDLIGSDEVRAYSEHPRQIYIGEGAATAWTDGATYVCLGRRFLKELQFEIPGFLRLGTVLLHAACHPEPDLEAHTHDQDFFERFHGAADSLGEFVEKCQQNLPLYMQNLGRRLTKQAAQQQDQRARLRKANAEHERRLEGQNPATED